ncbi:MAG: serine/threonine protein kinase [Anaerolineales bacterium]|nr:serine/threonine protein kinase [Anaerolineales bacterium]
MTDQKAFSNIGKYEILEKIGEGGFGIVYRGRDPMLEREVAIKVLKSDVATSPDFVERFRREARLAASLRHPNIATVIEVDEREGHYYLVMDYFPGGPLSALLKDGEPLPLVQAVDLLKPLADALDHAHAKGVIHRDVKPSNAILDEDGHPVLTDFGLVKSLAEEGDTTTGVVFGTAEYMSPEQVLGKDPGPATDIYALGVIAFQMLTGQVPFTGTTPFEVQDGHVNQSPPDPGSLNPSLPEEIKGALEQALSKNPEERFNSAGEFILELQQITNHVVQQQVQKMRQQASAFVDELEFDKAENLFLRMRTIQPSPGLEEEIKECVRRKKLWNELQELQAQNSIIEKQITDLSNNEAWIPELEQSLEMFPDKQDGRKTNVWDVLFFVVLILCAMATVALNEYHITEATYYIAMFILVIVPYGIIYFQEEWISTLLLIITIAIPFITIDAIQDLHSKWASWPYANDWMPVVPLGILFPLVLSRFWRKLRRLFSSINS